jgi:hypothetical protein
VHRAITFESIYCLRYGHIIDHIIGKKIQDMLYGGRKGMQGGMEGDRK